MRARAEALATAGLAVVAIATAVVPALAPLRPYGALPLALLLPGLAVSRLALPRFPVSLELFVLACGLSVAISIAAGLLLNLGGALTPLGWASALGGVTLLSSAAQFLRNPSPAPPVDSVGVRLPLSIGQAAMFAVACAIALCGVGLARVGAMSQSEYAFTEFWMTPHDPVARDVVTIGVRNEEKATTGYRVVIVADGATIGRWPPVTLDPGATWTVDFPIDGELRRARRVEAWLYREDDPKLVYRKVWLASSAN